MTEEQLEKLREQHRLLTQHADDEDGTPEGDESYFMSEGIKYALELLEGKKPVDLIDDTEDEPTTKKPVQTMHVEPGFDHVLDMLRKGWK